MPDPYVRDLGEIEDVSGLHVSVGVDYDSVTICGRTLGRAECEEFASLFVAACWEAADNARLMADGDT